MPSRNNPNLPSHVKRLARTKHLPRRAKSHAVTTKSTGRKQAHKKARNKAYALDRSTGEQAPRDRDGEVEMKDVGMSRRQKKLAARALAVKEANAKNDERKEDKEREKGAGTMEVD